MTEASVLSTENGLDPKDVSNPHVVFHSFVCAPTRLHAPTDHVRKLTYDTCTSEIGFSDTVLCSSVLSDTEAVTDIDDVSHVVHFAKYNHIIKSIIEYQDLLPEQAPRPNVSESISAAPDPTTIIQPVNPWHELKSYKSRHAKNLIFGSLNINSLRNKFDAMKDVLIDGLVDFLCISESKLDDSFPSSQFNVKGFYVHRQDSTATSGGLIVWVRNDIPNRRRSDLEINDQFIQTICTELHINKEKWFIVSVYRLPHSCVNGFIDNMCVMLDRALRETNMIVVMGDMNIDVSKIDFKSEKLNDFLTLYNLINKVNTPTCFKGSVPSVIDLCIVSQPRRFGALLNWNCGLSDWHNFIVISTKLEMPVNSNTMIKYRSYKNVNVKDFCTDIGSIPFHILDVFDDINDKYWVYNSLISDVIDEHAPIKTRYIKGRSVPHMNSELRKAMYKKRMSQNAYWRYKGNPHLWEVYRQARNKFVKINRQSRQLYFKERCKDGGNSRSFWQTIRPFITDKVNSSNDIMLKEEETIVTKNVEIADIFSEYYHNITDSIGINETCENISVNDIINKYDDHASIRLIKEKCNTDRCSLQTLNVKQVYQILSNINPKKATGPDNVPPKLLHLAKNEFAPSIASLVNYTILHSTFPDDLKLAEVSPCFKKGNPLDKTKYRPVSVLSCISKVIESAIEMQVSELFYNEKAGCLSAYRKSHNTESMLVKAVNDWKDALDEGKYCGAILMDLSKAFDVIPHGLLVAKINAYGFDENCVNLIYNYLNGRHQRVKVRQARSKWIKITKGVPQGSILGPTLFNIFINDLLFSVTGYGIYNYADDNTISCISESSADLVCGIEKCGDLVTEWFKNNGMQANPDKYQAIVFGRKNDLPRHFTIKGYNVQCVENVKLLGVEIDRKLLFDEHVLSICKKASRQINAVMRLSKVLDISVKENIFSSFIKSTFSYCPLVWMFCGHRNIRKLDRLQHRALRFVYNDFEASYSELLLRANSMSISSYLKYKLCIEVYKCVNNLAPSYICDSFEKKPQVYDMRDNLKLIQRKFNSVNYGYNAFKYYGSKVWNELPTHVKCSMSLQEFKIKVGSFIQDQ